VVVVSVARVAVVVGVAIASVVDVCYFGDVVVAVVVYCSSVAVDVGILLVSCVLI